MAVLSTATATKCLGEGTCSVRQICDDRGKITASPRIKELTTASKSALRCNVSDLRPEGARLEPQPERAGGSPWFFSNVPGKYKNSSVK